MTTLKEVFDEVFKDLDISKVLPALYRYHVNYLNQSQEYLSFFGSNLIGVHVIRFKESDILNFFKDVLKASYIEVDRELQKVTTINHEFKIQSDTMNLTIMYLIHRISREMKLSEDKRRRGCYDAALIFFYRCIAIRQSTYFHFPADPKIAQAAYAKLSMKFLIKRLGTWKAVMEYRAKDLINPEGIHFKNLQLFEDDAAITYAISDSENRIRELYKNYYAFFHAASVTGDAIRSSSSIIVDMEGIEKIKDKTRSVDHAISFIQSIVHDEPSFVKIELVNIITDINTNTSRRMLVNILTWMAKHSSEIKYHKVIDEFLKLVIVHSYHLIAEMGIGENNDVASILVTLKNLYLSTRSTDPDLMKIRRLGQKIVKEAGGKMNTSLEMASRTSLILYVTLRAISRSK